MTGREKLDLALEAARAVEASYRALLDKAIPRNVKEAVEVGWEIELAGMPVDVPDVFFYAADDRAKDRQKVLTMKRALSYFSEMESEAVEQCVKSPARLLWKKVKAYVAIVEFLWNHADELWDALKVGAEALYQELSEIDWRRWREIPEQVAEAVAAAWAAFVLASFMAALAIVATVVTQGVESVKEGVWLEMAVQMSSAKRRAQAKMTAGAFPQSNGRRVWRRKRTRT